MSNRSLEEGGDPWRRRPPVTPLGLRVLNPELYVKPNLRVGILGTGAFLLVVGGLLWQKHSFEQQQKALRSPPPQLEHVLQEGKSDN